MRRKIYAVRGLVAVLLAAEPCGTTGGSRDLE
jgi:hypothetical protein